eukprot:2018944-Amphidinium_carterae.1
MSLRRSRIDSDNGSDSNGLGKGKGSENNVSLDDLLGDIRADIHKHSKFVLRKLEVLEEQVSRSKSPQLRRSTSCLTTNGTSEHVNMVMHPINGVTDVAPSNGVADPPPSVSVFDSDALASNLGNLAGEAVTNTLCCVFDTEPDEVEVDVRPSAIEPDLPTALLGRWLKHDSCEQLQMMDSPRESKIMKSGAKLEMHPMWPELYRLSEAQHNGDQNLLQLIRATSRTAAPSRTTTSNLEIQKGFTPLDFRSAEVVAWMVIGNLLVAVDVILYPFNWAWHKPSFERWFGVVHWVLSVVYWSADI